MTQEELEALLSMGTVESEIADLLREQDLAQGDIDATRGKDYLTDAGRLVVANPWGAVSDMFVRGEAKKRAEKAEGDIANRRRVLDERTGTAAREALGLGLGGVNLRETPKVTPPPQFPMPQAPQVGPAPGGAPPAAGGGGPMGPPAPQPPPGPAPTPPPGPPAAPPGPPAPPKPPQSPHPMGAYLFGGGDDKAGLMEAISNLLARRGGWSGPGAGGI